MTKYRAYQLDESGHVFAPATAYEARTDAEAIARAAQWASGYDLEIWDESRRVGLIKRCDEKPAAQCITRPSPCARDALLAPSRQTLQPSAPKPSSPPVGTTERQQLLRTVTRQSRRGCKAPTK